MTITTTINRFAYTGNAVTTSFPVPFPYAANTDVNVYVNGVLMAINVDYTLTAVGLLVNGTLIFTVAPANAAAIVFVRNPAATQPLHLVQNDQLPSASLETAYDKLTLLVQRAIDLVSRSVRQPDSDVASLNTMPTKAVRASTFAAYDVNGDPIAAAGPTSGGTPISAFWAPILSFLTAPPSRASLGFPNVAAKGDIMSGSAVDTIVSNTVGADGTALQADSTQSSGLLWVPQLPRSLAPNPFLMIDQRVNSATSRANRAYASDRWYCLNQSNPVAVTTQTDQENGQPTNARIAQSNAVAQRFGYATVIEGKDCKHLRGKQVTFRPRVRISASQAVRIAVLEWTGTEDTLAAAADVVNNWTSGTYTGGNFFKATTTNVVGVGAKTPGAATWTDMDSLTVTLGSAFTNIILFVWVEQTAAQNVTLDIGKVRFLQGSYAGDIEVPRFADEFISSLRYYEKSFVYATAPAQNAGFTGAIGEVQVGGATTSVSTPAYFRVAKRVSPTFTTYNPAAANVFARNFSASSDCIGLSPAPSADRCDILNTTAAGSLSGQINYIQWSAEAEF